jgi:pilus assembly protein CpaF
MSSTLLPESTGNFGNARDTASPPPSKQIARDYEQVKQEVHMRLVNKLDYGELNKIPQDERRREIRRFLEAMIGHEEPAMNASDRERMIGELVDDTLGLGPLEILLRDQTISDILINGATQVYVERKGRLQESPIHFRDDDHVLQILDRIVSRIGRRVDESSPMVDARLPDGSRVNAVVAPLSLRGPTISIRRFGVNPLKLSDLLRNKALTPEMAFLLESAVKARLNVVISGGTGSGKTTLLNTLSSFISPEERIVTIEDAAELQLQQRHVVQLESRPPNVEGKGQITIRDLVRNSLRMRPNRIVIGECRGPEALDMLQAMNTGHDGSLTTLHANTPRDALSRLETMILMAGLELPVKAMREQVSSAIQVIVQTNRLQGGDRKVTSITEVVGMEGETILLQDIFHFRVLGVNPQGKAVGRFECTGVRPQFVGRLQAAGIDVPPDLFEQRVLLE